MADSTSDELDDLLGGSPEITPTTVPQSASVDALLQETAKPAAKRPGRPAKPKAEPAPAEAAVTVEEPASQQALPTIPSTSMEDIEASYIRDLEAQLAKPTSADGHPLAESELTPGQKKIRDLEDQLARRKASELEKRPDVFEDVEGGDGILLHVVEDGFTANGRVWYRGEELNFVKGSKAYTDTFDRNGTSWLTLSDSEQMRRWGLVKFRLGAWPGAAYEETEAQQADRQRNRKVPVLVL